MLLFPNDQDRNAYLALELEGQDFHGMMLRFYDGNYNTLLGRVKHIEAAFDSDSVSNCYFRVQIQKLQDPKTLGGIEINKDVEETWVELQEKFPQICVSFI